MDILLSKSNWFIIKYFCEVLGWLINGIFVILDAVGIPNIGLLIILFAVVVYVILTPIQIKQQKFSKMTSVMQPELQKIQQKYKGKKDQASQMKMQEETMAVYQKYGVSPTGSCLPLLIQMPILFGLYQVIYHIPGYVGRIRELFAGSVDAIMGISGYSDTLKTFIQENGIRLYSGLSDGNLTANNVTDILYMLKPAQWDKLADVSAFSGIADTLNQTAASTEHINMFLGINVTESPLDVIQRAWGGGHWLLLVGALLIPILAWFTQWLNYKLMPQASAAAAGSENKQVSSMERSMKTMNTVMPIMSAFFCLSFSIGIGIYWIAGAVIRCVQQVVINKHMSSMDVEELIALNQEKINKKRAKAGLPPQKITQQAKMSVRNIEEPKAVQRRDNTQTVKESTEYYKNTGNYKPGSLASKANMVRQFDEKKNKKK